MEVIHILKDGTVLHDITGHVVKMQDARTAYAVLDKISRKKDKTQKGESE